ncbi:MAG: ABC transporter permease [Acidobacteria bacterium]|nr:ABC transporter permease [Acidobacteriota bacterium]
MVGRTEALSRTLAGFLLRRLAASLLLLLLVLTVLFFLVRRVPGDPTQFGEGSRLTPTQRERLQELYGLKRPLLAQYLDWVSSVSLRFDWGTSLSQQRPVSAALLDALPATAILAFSGLAVEYLLALLLGIAAARRPGSGLDHAIRVGGLLLYSLPIFWLGLMAVLLFAYLWPVLPSSHMHSVDVDLLSPAQSLLDLGRHLVLPALVMGFGVGGGTARYVRARLLEVLGQDYIRTARAKGLSERRVLWVHALRNAAVPIVQLVGVTLPGMLSGALLIEVVFSWPGLGLLAFNAILARDYPLILGATSFSATLVILGNLAADLAHAWLDPVVRNEAA